MDVDSPKMGFNLTAISNQMTDRAPPQTRLPLGSIAVSLFGSCLAGLGERGCSGYLYSIDLGICDEATGDVSR